MILGKAPLQDTNASFWQDEQWQTRQRIGTAKRPM